MFDWWGKNENKSAKSQGILVSCVSGNPDTDMMNNLALMMYVNI